MTLSPRSLTVCLYTCFVLLFVGCGYLPPKFNATEYASLVRLAHLASVPNCDLAPVERLHEQSRYTKIYAQHLPNNEETFNALQEIDGAVGTLHDRVLSQSVSPTYCRMKHSAIELMTHTLLDAVGRKPR